MKQILLCGIALLAQTFYLHAQSWQEIHTISAFKDVTPEALAGGKILGDRIPVPQSKYGLSVETAYLAPLAPAELLKKMNATDASGVGEGSKDFEKDLHVPFSTPATSADFSKLLLDTEKSSDKKFISRLTKVTQPKHDLYLSRAEAARLGAAFEKVSGDTAAVGPLSEVWRELLLGRATTFQKGGLSACAPYENAAAPLRLKEELTRLFTASKDSTEIYQRFATLFSIVFNHGAQSSKGTPTFFWEQSKVQGETVLTLGTQISETTSGGFRQLELQFFVTSQYYTSLILTEAWPVNIEGKPHSLVWRGDYVLTPYIPLVKGIERLAAENIMLIEIKRSVADSLKQFSR
jgi:hypothetical protein